MSLLNVTKYRDDPVAFNLHFANIGTSLGNHVNDVDLHSNKRYLKKHITSRFNFDVIESSHTKKKINDLKNKTSSGFDGISLSLLKYISAPLLEPLTLIINQSLTTGIFPHKLKIAKIIPIYKKDKIDVLDNYRPISLLPSISKIFEKVIYTQVYAYFQNKKLFYDCQ